MSLPNFNDDDDDDDRRADSPIAFLRSSLGQPLPPDRDYLMVAIDAPIDAPERFLRLVDREQGVLWRSPHGMQYAGGGCVLRIDGRGRQRLRQLSEAQAAVFPRICVRKQDVETTAVPTLFGGMAFVPDVPSFGPWEEFGCATFALSRWGYRREPDRASLQLTVTKDELRDSALLESLLEKARTILAALDTDSATSLIERHDLRAKGAIRNISAEDWAVYIEAIKTAIRSGRFEKIVAARRCTIELPRPPDETTLMSRLYAAYPDCTRFAFRRSNATFLGATPETLFQKHGLEVKTHALAGTRRITDDPMFDSSGDARQLRQSPKDLEEHALVVKKICEELLPLSQKLRYSAGPDVRRVRNLVHLQTPITAKLRPEITAFDLLDALHPTPAVGGFPAKEAAEWLRENEPIERGWYTGALGFLDANGDAEFAVAIRCGVISENRVYVYAGAGIVRDSDPDSEYKETRAKLHPLLRAFGVDVSGGG